MDVVSVRMDLLCTMVLVQSEQRKEGNVDRRIDERSHLSQQRIYVNYERHLQ